LKSRRVGPRSCVVNKVFVENIRIRTTLVDFLPGLVAPRVRGLSPNWVNKLSMPFTFLLFILFTGRCWNIKLNIIYLCV